MTVDTLQAARAALFGNLDQGGVCPCCDKPYRKYKRTIIRRSLATLRNYDDAIDDDNPKGWAHVTKDNMLPGKSGSSDFAKFLHWGFIERKPNADPTKTVSGVYRITVKGRRWLRGEFKVHKSYIEYRNVVLQWLGDMVDPRDIVADFDYRELGDLPRNPPDDFLFDVGVTR